MLDMFKNHISENLSFLEDKRLLLAVSGGLDSSVLAHLCSAIGLQVSLAHCNFNLRGAESDADEDFVLQLAEELDLEVFIESFETKEFAKKYKLSTQVAARELRYDWFQALSNQLDFDYILTAHHADDNFETFLINLTRGTGLDGLTGIPEMNGNIVRPLLSFSREELEVYAIDRNIDWREDSSNATNRYLRNRLRHDIIPILKQINPQMLQSFQNTISHLKDSQTIIDDAIVEIQKKVVFVDDNVIKLNIKKLKRRSNLKAYLYELLKDFNFTQWNDVVNLIDAQSGKQVFSGTHRLLKDREFLLLSEIQSGGNSNNKMDIFESCTQTPIGLIFFDEVKEMSNTGASIIYVDKEKLQFPMVLRSWEKGDAFYPLGMKGKKKLSKYFKDEKLSLIDKENVWVLCSNDIIVWVIGMRADERFKITSTTTQILKIELQ